MELTFLKYYNKYKDKIYTYLLYRVNFNEVLAEDLASEVFLKAFEHFDSFDPKQSFQAWIYKIAKNHLLNYYRIMNREVELEENMNLKSRELKKIKANAELEIIFDNISRMDDYNRDVLLMRFVDGLDNFEIAQVLGKEEGTIRTQMSRALKILRQQIEI